MCGIFGIVGPGIIRDDLKVFYDLAFVNQLRGMDAFGVLRLFRTNWNIRAAVPTKFRIDIKKDTVCAYNFLNRKGNEDITESTLPVAIMGHCRSATVGDSKDPNGAHPFENERFVGFHNGTLIESKYRDSEKYVTDSEALWAEAAKSGLEETLAPLSVNSAFALAYFDKKDNIIGFVRNNRRPLYFATNQSRSVFYYSSEKDALIFALSRNNISFHIYGCAPWEHLTTKPDSFPFSKPSSAGAGDRINLWWIDEFKPAPVEPVARVVHHSTTVVGPQGVNSVVAPKVKQHDGMNCPGCGQVMLWASSVNTRNKADNPVYVAGAGMVCKPCHDTYGVNLECYDYDKRAEVINSKTATN